MAEPPKPKPARSDAELGAPSPWGTVHRRDQHTCHLAVFGFDEAVRFTNVTPEYEVSESSFSALRILKGHLTS